MVSGRIPEDRWQMFKQIVANTVDEGLTRPNIRTDGLKSLSIWKKKKMADTIVFLYDRISQLEDDIKRLRRKGRKDAKKKGDAAGRV